MAQSQEETTEKTVSEKRDKYIVAAIDFGTTYSGYAFSLKHHFKQDPTLHIVTNKWQSGQLLSHKAPTCVLFDKDGNFDCFGYDAEDKYMELAADEDENVDEWYYFHRFKMNLYNQKIHRGMQLKDTKGKELPAKRVFSESIKFLKDHLLEALTMKGTTMSEDDIHWVLTVPAIWSDAAKQFMRESAEEAGIKGALLSIALEPEAASLYCQHQHVEKDIDQAQSTFVFTPPKAGTKYAVIDLGGGTADITVHEKQRDGTLKEITQASGGAWGGMYVNEEFQKLLISIFGAEIYSKFKEQMPLKYLEMHREFESKKRSFKKPKDVSKKATVCSTEDLQKLYKTDLKEDIKEAITGHPLAGQVDFTAGRIRVNFQTLTNLFKPCIDNIVKHITDLIKKPGVKGTKVFLLVGGFSESSMVISALKKTLPDATIVVPPEPGLAVLKGAVVFGHSPLAVSSRVAKYSYGINISPPFDPNIHPHHRKVTIDGFDRCKDAFKKYIEKGSCLTYGMKVSGKHVTVKENQSDMLLKIFVSSNDNPIYCDEAGTEYAGKLVVKLPSQKARTVVEVNLIVGETELKVEAEEQASNKTFEAYFDFL